MKKSLVKWIIGVAVGVVLSGMTVCAEEDLSTRPIPSTNIVEHYDNKIMYVSDAINNEYRPVWQVNESGCGWSTTSPYNIGERVIGLTDSGYYVTEGWVGGRTGHVYEYIPKHLMQDTPNPGYVPVSEAEILTKLAEFQAMFPEGSTFERYDGHRHFDIAADRYVFGDPVDSVHNPTGRQSGISCDIKNVHLGDLVSTPDSKGRGIVTAVDGNTITMGLIYSDHIVHWNVKFSIDDYINNNGGGLSKRY